MLFRSKSLLEPDLARAFAAGTGLDRVGGFCAGSLAIRTEFPSRNFEFGVLPVHRFFEGHLKVVLQIAATFCPGSASACLAEKVFKDIVEDVSEPASTAEVEAIGPLLDKAGIKLVATERFARSDTSVTPQALKLTSANPDAILVVASGSGAAMPELGLLERGYKGKIYQTHAAATMDLMRVGGKAVDGTFVSAGPVIVPDQLPDSHPSKKIAQTFVAQYDKAYGAGSHNQFSGHAYDAQIALEKAIPLALKKAKPGTVEFRTALRDSDRKSTRLNSSHIPLSRMPSSA